jgi:hypothetical protein
MERYYVCMCVFRDQKIERKEGDGEMLRAKSHSVRLRV